MAKRSNSDAALLNSYSTPTPVLLVSYFRPLLPLSSVCFSGELWTCLHTLAGRFFECIEETFCEHQRVGIG
jgi:hypothetical protein